MKSSVLIKIGAATATLLVAFIVRPFGTKKEINVEDIQKYLIAPDLAALDIQGGTTVPFMQAGNI
jgi:hypothetical protein